MRARAGALAALVVGVWPATAHAAPPAGLPQGTQSNAAFARSYSARHVTAVAATTQRVSCYSPEVPALLGLAPSDGFPDGGGTACPGATTGESLGPYATQDVAPRPLLVKDHSESDLHVDPTNPRHLIGISKWFTNSEGYNHLTGFYESFDGGATWPQQGHIPGYEGWTDNSDPVGAFDPWGNFYAVVLPYMFSYDDSGAHNFLAVGLNPALPRMALGVAVRPHGARTANAWLTSSGGRPDYVATAPFGDLPTFDKQWIAIDTNRKSKHFGRVYVSWAIGNADEEGEGGEGGGDAYATGAQQASTLTIYESHADAHSDGTHTAWSTPKPAFRSRPGFGDNGSIPRVAPNGTVWMETSSFRGNGVVFTPSLTSSANGGATWAPRRVIATHIPSDYDNTTFRSAFGEAFAVGTKKVNGHYPLYLTYENAPRGPVETFLKASFDGGRHWRGPIRVNDNPGDAPEALQPGIAVAPSGTVAVTFYDRRLPCPARGTPEAAAAGLQFDPRAPYGRVNYCINTALQLYRPNMRPLGHNIRLSPHTWDPQLSAARFVCICAPGSFIGDYYGIDARGGFVYTSSVTTYNEGGANPSFHQQQLVSKLRLP